MFNLLMKFGTSMMINQYVIILFMLQETIIFLYGAGISFEGITNYSKNRSFRSLHHSKSKYTQNIIKCYHCITTTCRHCPMYKHLKYCCNCQYDFYTTLNRFNFNYMTPHVRVFLK